jgi:hypothetical protein
MIWLTWRQHRGEAAIIGGVLALLVALLVVTGRDITALYQQLGAAACAGRAAQPACDNIIATFKATVDTRYGSLFPALTFLKLAPALVGMLVGAPLVARELEDGTHRLVWTQSVTRWRWLAVKLGLVVGGCLLVAAVLTILLTWWRGPFDQLGGRIDAQTFDLEGAVPLAYMAFAVALAVAMGTLLRRTIPAMAVTLGGFFVVRLLIELNARPYYQPPSTLQWDPLRTTPNIPVSDWIIYDGFVDPYGNHADLGQITSACGVNGAHVSWQLGNLFTQCVHAHGWLGYIIYQPDNRFWLFQGIESAIFLGLAALLLALAVYWVRRRIA